MSEKYSFGASSVMREVPAGQTAVIKFNGKAEKVAKSGITRKLGLLMRKIL